VTAASKPVALRGDAPLAVMLRALAPGRTWFDLVEVVATP
jgi:hypothetical protein